MNNTNKNQFKAKDLMFFDIPTHSDEWYLFRTTGIPGYEGGIGASECGKLLGLDQYRPSVPELFHHKVGTYAPERTESIAASRGNFLESLILEIWTFWKGNDTADNIHALEQATKAMAGKPVNRYRNYFTNKSYIVNPKYPWLFISLDGGICAGESNVHGEALQYAAPLETKTIGNWAAAQWDYGCPPKYAVQVQQQMLVTESDYAELVMWEDGKIRVYFFEPDYNLQQRLIDVSYQFFERVKKARAQRDIILQYPDNINAINEANAIIMSLEPDPDDTDGYKEFMKERVKENLQIVQGKFKHYRLAQELKILNSITAGIKNEIGLRQNTLLKEMSSHVCSGFDFGFKEGSVYQKDKFQNSIKYKPNDEYIRPLVKTLLREYKY